MAKTIANYFLNGSTREFQISYEYLARKFIKVTLIGATRVELNVLDDYRFTQKDQITLNRAWGPADGFSTLEIRRVTSATDRLVNFSDGSILRAYDLNISQIQAIHIAEEGRDISDSALIQDGIRWNALGLPIGNVGTPSPTDSKAATNVEYVADAMEYALRTPAKVNVLPNASIRANKILGFNSLGQPDVLVPETGSAAEVITMLRDPLHGSNMVGTKQKYAGSVGRTAAEKMNDRVSVWDFGVVGDGVTDDTLAFSAAVSSGASIINFDGAKVLITTPVNVRSFVTLVGGGEAELICRIAGNGKAITVRDGFVMYNLKARPIGNSPTLIYGAGTKGFIVINNEFSFKSFTGIVPATLASESSRGIDLRDCSDVLFRENVCADGWNDHAYNSATAYEGNNLFRTVNIENHGHDNVSVVYNTFTNSWSPIYSSNTNFVDISHNRIKGTADTAIFERCTSGVTRHKSVNHNTIIDAGKGAIKVLDSNNLTAKGHHAQVVGNVISNYGIFLHTEAIFCQNYFNGSNYVEAPASEKARYVTIAYNQITNSKSESQAFGITNCKSVVMYGNIVDRQFAGGRAEIVSQYCTRVKFIGNEIENNGPNILVFNSDEVTAGDNTLIGMGPVTVNAGSGTSGNSYKFTENTIVNTMPGASITIAYGILLTNVGSNVIGSLEVYGNKFKVGIPFEDSSESNGRSMVSVGSQANAERTFMDNNIIQFTDYVKRQKVNFGDIINPLYYLGYRGAAVYDSATDMLTIKPSSDRLAKRSVKLT